MKKRFTEEQILAILRQIEQGQTLADVLREHGVVSVKFRTFDLGW